MPKAVILTQTAWKWSYMRKKIAWYRFPHKIREKQVQSINRSIHQPINQPINQQNLWFLSLLLPGWHLGLCLSLRSLSDGNPKFSQLIQFKHCVNKVTEFLTQWMCAYQATGALHHIVLTWLHFVLSPKKHARLTWHSKQVCQSVAANTQFLARQTIVLSH